MRMSLPSRARGFALALLSTLAGVLFALALPTSALAAELCPNEQLRAESNVNPATAQPYSMQLPDCRAYELVSPANSEGWGMPASTSEIPSGSRAVIVSSGESVFFASAAQPADIGAPETGHYENVFHSRRTAAGWSTREITAFGSEAGASSLIAASRDGSAALISTSVSMSPEDLDNPQRNVTGGLDLYVLRERVTPEFVTHGEVPFVVTPNTTLQASIATASPPYFWNSSLSAVGFVANAPLSLEDEESGAEHSCYIWQDVGTRLAHLTNREGSGTPPLHNCGYLAVTAAGQPIVEITSGEAGTGDLFATGDGNPASYTQLSGPDATFDALSNGETAFLTTKEHLSPGAPSEAGANVYAVDLALTTPDSGAPPHPPAVTCVTCEARGKGLPNSGSASWVGQSADGSHVFFTTSEGLWSWSAQAGEATLLTSESSVSQLAFSENGQHAVGLAGSPQDLYEFTAGQEPKLLAPGSSNLGYAGGSVSNSGARVIYDRRYTGGNQAEAVIDEWVTGATTQISPAGAPGPYEVLGTAGAELENVFFAATDALSPDDLNAGNTDIYDARIYGGFPAPTEPTSDTTTPNPVAPGLTAYTGGLTPPSVQPALLSPDTSRAPAAKAKAKSCKRGFVKVRGKCVKRRAKKAKVKKASRMGVRR